MKTAISVPDTTFERVDAVAARLGMSRSELFARAAERWIDEFEAERTTEQIDAVLADGDDGDNDAFLGEAARRLPR